VPVGVPPFPVTVAVNVTDCPAVLGFGDDVSLVVVGVGFTVCVVEPELGEKLLSPLYDAVTWYEPASR